MATTESNLHDEMEWIVANSQGVVGLSLPEGSVASWEKVAELYAPDLRRIVAAVGGKG